MWQANTQLEFCKLDQNAVVKKIGYPERNILEKKIIPINLLCETKFFEPRISQ